MKESFSKWNPDSESLALLDQINQIHSKYNKQSYRLTLRQLYYRMVTRKLIRNSEEEYEWLEQIFKAINKELNVSKI